MIRSITTNIRFYFLATSILLSIGIFTSVTLTNPVQESATIELTQLFGLIGAGYLYLALLAGPLCHTFPNLPYRTQYLKARRALGVSAFYFSLLHGVTAFFFQLGGFSGLPFLTENYLLSLFLSFIAFVILFLLAITSFDKAVVKLKFKNWKLLHRLVYLAGFLIVIHVLMLGSHFSDLTSLIPVLFFVGLAFLLLFEARRVDAHLINHFPIVQKTGPIFLLVILTIGSYGYFLLTSPEGIELSIHAEHIRLAKQAQEQSSISQGFSLPQGISNQGLTGDKTKRYTVSFNEPENTDAKEPVELRFSVFNATSGNPTTLFNTIYTKTVHMIIVDETLTYYDHIHPTQKGNEFAIETSFPRDGIYHIYLDFQPFSAVEQQFAFTLPVGDGEAGIQPVFQTHTTKQFGDYEVTLQKPTPLRSEEISIGLSELAFTLRDSQTREPLTNLEPYLSAFGHLVMIHTETFDYVHVHPSVLQPPAPSDRGGPTVRFIPLGLYGPIKPGEYRLFAQFNPGGNLFTSDFVLTVE